MVILQMTLPFYISYYVVKGIHTLEDKRKSLNSIEENKEDKRKSLNSIEENKEDKRKSLNSIEENKEDKQKRLNPTKENKEGNQKSKITEINNQTVTGEKYEVTK